ncbi:hypothetical protein [Haladaptatus caseinilyticus]|uniref:hypothetical protein n=1 Tax=Haladaptatus caseinilyticus TaxID=2993314 RepID=UPI00224B93D9|nr:hypothetical protein [Haladaptatus caseinilyticus]
MESPPPPSKNSTVFDEPFHHNHSNPVTRSDGFLVIPVAIAGAFASNAIIAGVVLTFIA